MNDKNNKEITNSELLESINRSFSRIEEKMATKDDLQKTELNLQSQINNLQSQVNDVQTQINDVQSDAKSFRQETKQNFIEVNEKLDDLSDTVMNHDKRIELLETKVFA